MSLKASWQTLQSKLPSAFVVGGKLNHSGGLWYQIKKISKLVVCWTSIFVWTMLWSSWTSWRPQIWIPAVENVLRSVWRICMCGLKGSKLSVIYQLDKSVWLVFLYVKELHLSVPSGLLYIGTVSFRPLSIHQNIFCLSFRC